ncbi:MAG TPA: trigger factor [bacterium]|nr:trigger factor [bacterium]
MTQSIKKISNSEIEIKVEIPSEEFALYYRKAISDLGKDIEIKGFRKGHVPQSIIEEKIGTLRILERAAQEAVTQYYIKIVKENNLQVIDRPKIEILKMALGSPFSFRARVTVLPEIELPDYRKIASSLKREKVQVSDQEVQKTIDWLRRSRAKLIALGREARKGDFVEIEYFSPQIENGKKRKDGFILGQGGFIPGFEQKIEGMKAGQETEEFSLTIPQNHFVRELAGKKVTFKIKLISVFRMELPELNDRFAQSLGNFRDLSSLKESIREGILAEKENKAKEKFRQKILEKIINSIRWDIPQVLIEAEKNRLFSEFKESFLNNSKMSFEDYLAKTKKTEKEIKDSFLEAALRNIKISLVLREISKRENITASPQEIEDQINQLLKNYPDIESAKSLDLEKLKEYTKERIINEKTLQLLEGFAERV